VTIGRVTYRYEDLGDEAFQELVSALVAWDGSRRARTDFLTALRPVAAAVVRADEIPRKSPMGLDLDESIA
jgi:hypothetical protein